MVDCPRLTSTVVLSIVWLLLLIMMCAMPWQSLGDGKTGAVPKGPPDGLQYHVNVFKATINVPAVNVHSESLIDAFTCKVRLAGQNYALWQGGSCGAFDAMRALLLLSMMSSFLTVLMPFSCGYSGITTAFFYATWLMCAVVGILYIALGAFTKTHWPVFADLGDLSTQPQTFDGMVWGALMIICTFGPMLFLLIRPICAAAGGGYSRMAN